MCDQIYETIASKSLTIMAQVTSSTMPYVTIQDTQYAERDSPIRYSVSFSPFSRSLKYESKDVLLLD